MSNGEIASLADGVIFMPWVVTDDVYAETWRRLHEFANIELTIDELVLRHGPPATKPLERSYRKQAQQVRVSVLQAKEYFDAASNSSLFTSPNHLYYGAVALSAATMLLLGDGTYSLDYLRKEPKNAHHGLRFTTGANSADAAQGLGLLEKSYVEILSTGHFKNWYSTLPSNTEVFAYVTRSIEGATQSSRRAQGQDNTAPFISMAGRKYSALALLQWFPDLAFELRRYGVNVAMSRTTHKVDIDKKGKIRHTWLIHGGAQSLEDRNKLLDGFKIQPRYIEAIKSQFEENTSGGIITIDQLPDQHDMLFEWPSNRDSLSHETISYAETLDRLEVVDGFLLSYQLSMLSRYFPDLWIHCLESQCRAAKLIERAVDILRKKIPMLTLSLLVRGGITVSTHREPWRSI